MKQVLCFLNGKILPLKKASINPYDLGFLRGYGAFDVMRAIDATPIFFEAHFKRLRNSLKLLNIRFPLDGDAYHDAIRTLLRRNGFRESTVRTIVTGGIGADSMTPKDKPTIIILIEERHAYPETYYKKGVKIITLPHARHLPKAKTSDYIEALRHTDIRQAKHAIEILYVRDDHALEASTSNIFIVKNGVLITPGDGILHGITRAAILSIARKEKIRIEERAVTKAELTRADECFLTATNKEILPIVLVDATKIGDGKVGPMTKLLLEKYRTTVLASLPPTNRKKIS